MNTPPPPSSEVPLCPQKSFGPLADLPKGEPFHSIFQTMSEAAAFHRLLFNEVGEAVDYEFIQVNPAFELHTGIPLAEVIGRKGSEVFHCSPPPFLDSYTQVGLKGDSLSFKSYVPQLERHLGISAFSPKQNWFVTVFSDISEHVFKETQLRRTNRLYCFLSQLNKAVLRANSPETLLNEVCKISIEAGGFKMAWFGVPDSETQRFTAIASAGDAQAYLERIRVFADQRPEGLGPTGKCFRENHAYICKDFDSDPSTLPWREAAAEFGLKGSAAFPICRGGNPFGALMFYSAEKNFFHRKEVELLEEVAASLSFALDHLDQENRRQLAEKELSESESRFRQLTENLDNIFWMIDLDSHSFVYVSPSYEKISGRSCHSLLENPDIWLDAVHPEDRPRMEELHEELREKSGRNFDEVFRIERPDGEIRWIHDRAFVLRDSEGRPYRVAGIAEDFTESKLLNEQVLRAQRMDSIGALASGVAHDLNNILAPIVMAISMLREKITDPFTGELLTTIEESANRGADIVKQVLAFSRGEGVRSTLTPQYLVNQLGRMVKKTFPKSISFSQSLPADLWSINVDATQLHQVLLNLCVNARDAMPEGGYLIVSAANRVLDEEKAEKIPGSRPGRFVELRVTDTGSGIPEEVLGKMFDPFFTTKKAGQGTGLGLSTVLGIVKSHNGFLTVDSKLGHGSVFCIYLPATDEAPPLPSEEPSTKSLPQGDGTCVLLVDDEESILSVMGRVLARNGYQVLTAQNGVEALSVYCASAAKVDVVITDLMMPQMDGIKLARGLLKLDPTLPIIASSGHSEEPRRQELNELGIEAFLRKPYTTVDLLQALHKVRSASTSQK